MPTEGLTISEEERLAKEIVDSIITDDMSEFEKAIVIHDWLAYNVTYAYEALGYDELVAKYNRIDVALTERKAVCGGYGRTYELMCNLAGLEVNYVISKECNHGWNQVKIDGEWYNVDVTNDSSINKGTQKGVTYEYFLFSNKSGSSSLHIMDAGPYEICSYDYDIEEIMEYSLKNTVVKDVYYCKSKEEAIEKLSSAIETGKNRCTLWVDIENLPEGYMPMSFEEVRKEMMGKYGVLVEDIELDVDRDGIWMYNIGIHDIDSIPVATSYQEMLDEFNILWKSYARYRHRFYIVFNYEQVDSEMWSVIAQSVEKDFDSFTQIWNTWDGGILREKFWEKTMIIEIQKMPRVGEQI